jgi:hypothetical protein
LPRWRVDGELVGGASPEGGGFSRDIAAAYR